MTENCLSDRPGYGRTFRIAMGVIGGIASFQILAIGFGVLRRAPAPTGSSDPSIVQFQRNDATLTPPFFPEPGASAADELPLPVHPLASAAAPANGTAMPPPAYGAANQVVPPSPGGVAGPSTGAAPIVPVPQASATDEAPLGANIAGALRSVGPSPGALSSPPFGAPAAAPLGGIESPSLSAALAVAARSNELSGEPILERLMSTGAELRGSGNMQGALKAFREVETALPDQPRILAELAATLSQMGLTDKANAYWKRVEDVGPVVAGAYFTIAGQQLRGEVPPTAGPGTTVMKIGEVRVEEQAPTSEGQQVTLRVIVDGDPNARPIGDDLTLLVYFYDRVTGGAVEPSTADTAYDYPSAPYDWQSDGTEEIVVRYNQPVFTEEQKLELGERSYYGYAIELYYRDRIQHKVVMPEDIALLRQEAPSEPAPAGEFLGPENALFPDSVYP